MESNTMVGVEIQSYLSPITLEAELFAKSLETLSKTDPYIDKNLIKALDKVVKCIENFLDQKNHEIRDHDKCQLIDATQLISMSTIFICQKCNVTLGKSSKTATKHIIEMCCKNIKPVKQKQKGTRAVRLSTKAERYLTGNFNSIVINDIKVADRIKFLPEYDIIEAELLRTIQPHFTNACLKIYRFGSRFSGIGSKDSDIDFFIDIGNTFKNFENRPSLRTIEKLNITCKALRKNNTIWKNVIKITNTRVPILKAYHNSTGFECDIGFSNSLSVINTKIMENFFDVQPIARAMCFILKRWLLHVKLNERFNTYTIVLMVIFFLQIRNQIPTVELLQSRIDFNTALHIGPWLGTFAPCSLAEVKMEKIIVSEENCKKFISDFFEYYINFDYTSHIICPYLGKLIKIKNVDEEMPTWYKFYVAKSPIDCKLCTEKPMVVQNPIQLNSNVANKVTTFELSILIQYMKMSFEVLNHKE